MERLTGNDRLIVALDVPGAQQAIALVEALDRVSFFKIGWQLFMAGAVKGELRPLIERLAHKSIFIDLKIPGDIDNTIAAVVDFCAELGNVKFLTLSDSMPAKSVAAAKAARQARRSDTPRFLTVPLLSSLDASDLGAPGGEAVKAEEYVVRRARAALDAGCDGVIASGQAIRLCRRQLPANTVIVSPGIRPVGRSTDEHKRSTTPAEAIRMGADYLVVGRPITRDSSPRDAAKRVIDEIDEATTRPAVL